MGSIRIPAWALTACLAWADGAGAADPREWSLKELFQQSQFVVEGRLIPRSARPEPISFADTGTAIPTLSRDAWRFIRLTVYKNVLGQDLPDTLLVFDAGTAAAVQAQRIAYLGGVEQPPEGHYYRSSLGPASMARERMVILFLDQVVDDSLVTPRDRLELSAVQAYEKSGQRARVRALAAHSSQPENP